MRIPSLGYSLGFRVQSQGLFRSVITEVLAARVNEILFIADTRYMGY